MIATLLVLGGLIYNFRLAQSDDLLDSDGVATNAQVIDLDCGSNEPRHSRPAVVQYAYLVDGISRWGTATIGDCRDFKVGGPIAITYLPARPEFHAMSARVRGGQRWSVLLLALFSSPFIAWLCTCSRET